MQLDYPSLISPFPLEIENVAHIKSPTLREIWHPTITYKKYNIYISLMLLDSESFCSKIDNDFSKSLEQSSSIFDIIAQSKELQMQYSEALSFFLTEDVIWHSDKEIFVTYKKDNDGNPVPYGILNKSIWTDICDIILQRNGINNHQSEAPLKFKGELAREVWELTHPKKKDEKENKNIALSNLISAVAAKDESLNMVNIWDLTVFNLYDQFKRHHSNTFYDIAAMSVAAWGDEKNNFDSCGWYNNIYEN